MPEYNIDSEFNSYLRPGVAVDIVLFSIVDGKFKVALIKRDDEPYFGNHALPGRFVRYDEKIEDTAKKALETKGNINTSNIFLEQLYTFGQNLDRDTRIRTISIVYYALINSKEITEQTENKFYWFSINELPSMAFDHERIVKFAFDYLYVKIWDLQDCSSIIMSLLPEKFTLTELQQVYETICGKLDKRNFRKKFLDSNILKPELEKRDGGAFRPAQLFSFYLLSPNRKSWTRHENRKN